jgi:hypothetical protein
MDVLTILFGAMVAILLIRMIVIHYVIEKYKKQIVVNDYLRVLHSPEFKVKKQ